MSDYRGKVVVLTFWASWCGPCMGMVPQERSLVKRLEGKPFVLLGFNGDDEKATARQVAHRERMTWRSWWDEGRDSKVVRRWNVIGWPTTYVLDAQGVIKYKNIRDQELDDAIDTLIREQESTKTAGTGACLPARRQITFQRRPPQMVAGRLLERPEPRQAKLSRRKVARSASPTPGTRGRRDLGSPSGIPRWDGPVKFVIARSWPELT